MAYPKIIRLIIRNIMVNSDPGTWLILVGMPAMFLIFFSYGYGSMLSSMGLSYISYAKFLAPGMLAYETLIAGTATGSMLWFDRRWGSLAQILAMPFTRTDYLLGLILSTVIFAIMGNAVLIIISYFIIPGLTFSILGLLIMVSVLIIGSLLFGSFMLILASYIKSQNAYNSIQILIIFLINFASTVFYPASSLPKILEYIFYLNPLTYIANLMRDGFLKTIKPTDISIIDIYELIGLIILSILLILIARYSYMRSEIRFE
ncbi:ABC-type polysaccharide/polyol phosphate export systems, permease component [Caldisphaera lagunensis DSM 15908]|uniref:ABC-type polysaccharide/polyol phosphate export systems, permease component n=1 Tax=Caldisphaera lagunensis (strain DSM 15908 / JCM 11604 / ANMR 0165 / IC-154) TaxID=1056495 RepID=L0A846_CALLD|nr:ABC transporter permease [Caldisphaera lagunensis]AFZ70043.1 ABC-type polysaccharide/polyol phosphate export systems, permease component [Caldisphaera lagunensis DSM 15908]